MTMEQYIYLKYNYFGCTILILLILLAIFSKTVHSIEKVVIEPSIENANWLIFTNRSQKKALALSPDGKTLWVGTEGGLEQWNVDRQELLKVFQNIDGLPSNDIKTLLVDNDNELWVGTDKGLACLDTKGKWHQFNAHNGLGTRNSTIVNALVTDNKGTIWIGMVEGVFSCHDQCENEWLHLFHHEFLEAHVESLLIEENGQLWAGTKSKGLARQNPDGSWTHYVRSEHLNTSNNIIALAPDSNGGLWLLADYDPGVADYSGHLGLLHFQAGVISEDSINFELSQIRSGRPALKTLLADKLGGLWIGTEDGLIYRHATGQWQHYSQTNQKLPFNGVMAITLDDKGGLWIGNGHSWKHEDNLGDLAYLPVNSNKAIKISAISTGVPSNHFFTLLADDSGGLWVGGNGYRSGIGGLSYYSANAQWKTYTPQNSKLPSRNITSLTLVGNDDLWVGTQEHGLTYLTISNDQWETDFPQLPGTHITALASDPNGLWVGTKQGLAHRNTNNQWQIFNSTNSLPILDQANISSLLTEPEGGLWVGISHHLDECENNECGLVYHSPTGEWHDINLPNPNNAVLALAFDGKGGIWVGTERGLIRCPANQECQEEYPLNNLEIHALLAIQEHLWIGTAWGNEEGILIYRDANGQLVRFNQENSDIPMNTIKAFALDKPKGVWNGGLWIGGSEGGLARLSFGEQSTVEDPVKRQQAQYNNRAAILIHPRGTEATDFIATYVYQVLYKRYYKNDDIYFISYKPDLEFNRDGQTDSNIVDAPLTLAGFKNSSQAFPELKVAHVGEAFQWAKNQGKLDEPLIVVFVDHGSYDNLILSPNEMLNENQFKLFLDDYQDITGNQVIVILEACYAGTLLDTLADNSRRLIISSTNQQEAYLSGVSSRKITSFLTLYFNELSQGDSFEHAFELVRGDLPQQGEKFRLQHPILVGDIALDLCLSVCDDELIHNPIRFPENEVRNGVMPLEIEEIPNNNNFISSIVATLIRSQEDGETAIKESDQHQFGNTHIPLTKEPSTNHWKSDPINLEENKNGKYAVDYSVRDTKGNDLLLNRSKTYLFVNLPYLGTQDMVNATFVGGISVEKGNYQQKHSLSLSQSIDVLGAITVDEADRNKYANIFVYVEVMFEGGNEPLYYILEKRDGSQLPTLENLNTYPWNQNLVRSKGFMKNVILPKTQEVHIFNGLLSSLPDLRNVKVFFGYQLVGNGKMVKNNQPIEFETFPVK
jgi:ligand-binding sensor domain-containing protein